MNFMSNKFTDKDFIRTMNLLSEQKPVYIRGTRFLLEDYHITRIIGPEMAIDKDDFNYYTAKVDMIITQEIPDEVIRKMRGISLRQTNNIIQHGLMGSNQVTTQYGSPEITLFGPVMLFSALPVDTPTGELLYADE